MNAKLETPTLLNATSAQDAARRDYEAAMREASAGLATHEDIFDTLTLWLRVPHKSRELKVEASALGLVAKLYESGVVQATGRGKSSDDAIAHALEDVIAREGMADPDEAEDCWNRELEGIDR